MPFRATRFRPVFGLVLTGVVAAVAVAALVALAFGGGLPELLRYGALPVFAAALCAAMFWSPRLEVDDHAVVVRNVLRTFHIPWSAIQRIDTKYALTLYTPSHRVPVWVAPAPSRFAVGGMTVGDARRVAESARAADLSVRPGDVATTSSGAPAEVIRRHWQELRDDGELERGAQAIRVEYHVATIAVLVALAAAGAVGLAV